MNLKKPFQLVCHELVWAPLLSVFIGLFTDFQGMSSIISDAIPILKAFIPVMSLYGIAFCTILILFSLPRYFSYFNSLRPSVRFSEDHYKLSCYRDRVLRTYGMYNNNFGRVEEPYALCMEITSFLREKFDILCPTVDLSNQDYVLVWYGFLVQITSCSLGKDLHNARKIGKAFYCSKDQP